MAIFRALQKEMQKITARVSNLKKAPKRSKVRMVYDWDRIKELRERMHGVQGAVHTLIQMLQVYVKNGHTIRIGITIVC